MQQLKLPELLLYVCGNVISNAGLYVHVIKLYIRRGMHSIVGPATLLGIIFGIIFGKSF